MRRQLAIWLFLLPSLIGMAQTFHAFTVSADGGFAAERLGATGGLHVGYGLRANHFLLQLGLGAGYDYLNASLPNYSEVVRAVDSEQFGYLEHRDYSDLVCRRHRLEAQLPLLLGGMWQHVYFLLGATPALSLFEQQELSGMVTTSGEYDMFYDIFVDMPNHGYGPQPYRVKASGETMTTTVYASAEVGAPLGDYLRLGAFADYGVYTTGDAAAYRVGLRLTAWFGRTARKRYPCHCVCF